MAKFKYTKSPTNSGYITMGVMTIGDMSAEQGTKKFGYLKVTDMDRTFYVTPMLGPARPRAVLIPVMIINGSKPGPVLCVTAGTHACEYNGVEAGIRLYKQSDPSKVKGGVIIVPVVNPASFWTRSPYVNVQDNVDISSCYGREGSSVSYVIAKSLLQNVLSKADYIFDIHGGDLLEAYYSRTGFTKIGDKEVDEKSEMLARTFGLKIIQESSVQPGTTLRGKQALKVPQAMAEVGCCGRLEEENVEVALRGITNIMKKLGMVEGKPIISEEQTVWQNGDWVYTESAGIFYPKVKPGDRITKGQLIGEIGNLQGEVVERLIAPHDGMIILSMYNPVKLPGDLVFKCFKK
jgi:hypothetical protein